MNLFAAWRLLLLIGFLAFVTDDRRASPVLLSSPLSSGLRL